MTTPEQLMTGAEHYREAEKLTTLAAQNSRERPHWAAEYLAAAQVHATLALAADATAIAADLAWIREHWTHAFFSTRSGT